MAGYAIKKVIKIAAVIVGFFVAGLSYLSYKGWVDVKWVAMEKKGTIGGGFFGGMLVGYAIKDVIKMVAVIIGCLTDN